MLRLGTIPQACTSNGRIYEAAPYGFRKKWLLRMLSKWNMQPIRSQALPQVHPPIHHPEWAQNEVTNTHGTGCRMFRYMIIPTYSILLHYTMNRRG